MDILLFLFDNKMGFDFYLIKKYFNSRDILLRSFLSYCDLLRSNFVPRKLQRNSSLRSRSQLKETLRSKFLRSK